ncbi:hypothetical protein [Blastococcus sp. SYSU D00695]
MDLDDVADALYAVPPEQFVAARTARVDEARAAGDRPLATAIGGLAKPSTAAWVVNLLVRAHRDEIRSLVELGGLLREAQESLAGDQLRELNTQRGRLLSALTRQAAAGAREHGATVSSAVSGQVEDTLRAAMADPAAGEAVLAGRLTSPLSYSGMGGVTGIRPALRVVPEPAAEPPRRGRRADGGAAGGGEAAGDRRAREEERRREREEAARRAAEERHRREVAEAREEARAAAALAEETAERAAQERERADALAAREEELRARVDALTAELARAEEEAGEVAAELRRAQRHRTTAERQARDAAAARDRAEAHLGELADGG